MAKNRMVSTSFWSDNYSANLDPIEKLLFIYLMTNERSTLAGVYELPLKIMAVETGIEIEMLKKILGRFDTDDKVRCKDGWIAIKNFLKYHEHGSPTVKKGIDEAIKASPEWARSFIGKGMHTLTPSTSTSTSTSRDEAMPRIVLDTDDPPEKPSKFEPDQVYLLFKQEISRYPLSWKTNKAQRIAAENLWNEHGEDQIRKALIFYRENREESFCPSIDNPWDLDTKWGKLINFKSKKDGN